MRQAISHNLELKTLTIDPFQGYKAKWKHIERGFLTQHEVDLLENHDFSSGRIKQVRDVFIFQCYTGISHSDLPHMVLDPDGGTILGVRKKTGMKYVVLLLPSAKRILEEYHGSLPIDSNQRANSYLKEIGKMCNIDKHLTTHLARHTFATTILLENTVPMEIVAKMLGHNNIRSTEVYGKVLKTQVMRAGELLGKRYKPKD